MLWSSLATLTTLTPDIPPFQLLAQSLAMAGLLGLAGLLRPGGPGWAAVRQPISAWMLGSVALFGYHALYFFALKQAPVVEANLINYLWPLLIVLFSAAVSTTRLRPLQWAGVLLGFMAMVLVVTQGERIAIDASYHLGYLAALAAAVVWAGYSVLNRRFVEVNSSAIVVAMLTAALMGVVLHCLQEDFVMPDADQAWVTLAIAVGPLGAAFWLWDYACKHGNLVLLGMLSFAAPLLSTVLLLMAGQSTLHWSQAVAVVLLIAGANWSVRTKPQD